MNVLWINMTVPPEADAQLGGEKELRKTGGWVLGLAHYICKQNGIKLAIASESHRVKKITEIKGEDITYYIIPTSNRSRTQDICQRNNWQKVKELFSPDIVHIHGTEYHHALTWLEANGAKNTVVSIQGLVSVYYDFYNYGLKTVDIIRNITLRDIYKGSLFHDACNFKKRGYDEINTIQSVNHIIGRTHWDKIHSWKINPNAKYHFCNEILRPEFYGTRKWNYEGCSPFTIFVNQSAVPYKGLHMLIRALPIILVHYPTTRVRIAGYNILTNTFWHKIKRTGYGKIILKEIEKYGLQDRIHFTGMLNAEGMISEYIKANVFVCPSAIENSPNALGEAQIIGVPCIASNVGGVSDMIPDNQCGLLYRFSEPVELAYSICSVFEKSQCFDNRHEIEVAEQRHSPNKNIESLLSIYRTIQDQDYDEKS